MASATGVTITKKFTYRGSNTEEWSNKYWLTVAPPQTDAAWETLVETLQQAEAGCYSAASTAVRAIGYDDDVDGAHAVFTIDWEALGDPRPGQLAVLPDEECAGDQAAILQWATARKSSRGKWIYLRKYFHSVGHNSAEPDNISASTGVAFNAFGTLLLDGSNAILGQIRSQTQVEELTGRLAHPYMTTRTLKRRGRRPLTPAATGHA